MSKIFSQEKPIEIQAKKREQYIGTTATATILILDEDYYDELHAMGELDRGSLVSYKGRTFTVVGMNRYKGPNGKPLNEVGLYLKEQRK